jgi:hypothetical protein
MNKFYLGIIAVLLVIIFLQRACTPQVTPEVIPQVTYDTILKHDTSVVVKKMKITSHELLKSLLPLSIVYRQY